LLIKSRKEAIKDLEELCEQLQERNLQMARNIMDTDRSSFARTNELLIQTEQKRVREIQLDLLKAKVVEAQKELRRLKTYKDMEFPVKALQIADMERKLDRLKEMQQKEQEDLNLFFKKEMVNLERRQCQREQDVLSAKHASHIPPIVKLMASQNDTMREEIHKQKKWNGYFKILHLFSFIQELQLSRPKNIRREIFPDVFLKSDKKFNKPLEMSNSVSMTRPLP
uniref:Uncharacterized protein n=1 Tax=Sinocyclocheilus anshuiensis TaxID=1608454 RepID=A0A671RKX0_9TELE